MPGRDDFDDGDRPRRRQWDDEDRPPRSANAERRPSHMRPQKPDSGPIILVLVVAFLVICGGVGGVAFWAVRAAKQEMAQVQAQAALNAEDPEIEAQNTTDDLEEIAKAIRAYEAIHRALPNNSYDEQGHALLSWRVHILPFLGDEEATALYREFHLSEPWDSPHNLLLADRMPARYETTDGNAPFSQTYYRGFSQAGAIFEKPRPGKKPVSIRLDDGIPDGASNTILIIEAGDPVDWSKPDNLDWPVDKPRPNLGGVNPTRPYIIAAMADGRSKRIRRDVSDQSLRLLIGRDDRQPVPFGWEHFGPRP